MAGLRKWAVAFSAAVMIWAGSTHVVAQRTEDVFSQEDKALGGRQEIYNSERSTDHLLMPEEAARSIQLSPGFSATQFAGEPDVRQPIAITLDDRGRLWVAENYTYAESTLNFDTQLRDRILVFEDSDHDGRHDRRTVFWDQGSKLSSVAVGLGGVWALCAPQLLFIPDGDRDDVPDGPPVVMLDGWDDDDVRHNIVNGLRFGPDGWLYGRHGILATSYVGRPGTPAEERTPINCGIWRFHPTRHTFEVVVHGTTNPWGHDWDARGELFFINTVIGHLWHAVPGAHFERMYGEDFNAHLYELCSQTADHFHWDTRETWSDVREAGVSKTSSAAGGGHAHAGLMIYQGDNWPDEYRGDVFAINLHGRRVNRDHLERRGTGFIGRHRPDLLHFGDRWFRGLDLIYGPDGGVYINDWSDAGECHEHDGVHRTSGRIYKVVHGHPTPPKITDVAALSDRELVLLQLADNQWWVRRGRLALHERAIGGADMRAVNAQLRGLFREQPDMRHKLRAMWCLHVTGAVDESWLVEQLRHPEAHIRTWAVRLLVDRGAPAAESVSALTVLAGSERDGLVLVYLASALQRLPLADRWPLAGALARRHEFIDDPMFTRMIWYGVEPAVLAESGRAIHLAEHTRIAKLRRFIARRLTGAIDRRPEGAEQLVRLIAGSRTDQQRDILAGMLEGLRGWRSVDAPAAWSTVEQSLAGSHDQEVRQLAAELGVVFGGGRAAEELRRIAEDDTATSAARRRALAVLLQNRPEDLAPLLTGLLKDRYLAADAIGGLTALGQPETAESLIASYSALRPDARLAALDGLTSRRAYAAALLDAVSDERIERSEVPVYQVRRMRLLADRDIDEKLDRLWPELAELSGETSAQMERYRKQLGPIELAAADPRRGKSLFIKACATCHKLYGEGGDAGPDLTGSNRGNLDYLLLNLLDPSGEVAQQYRMSVLELTDGRSLQGVATPVTDATIQVRTPTETIVLQKSAVEAIEETSLSLMPEGQLQALTDDEVRDLIAYLMAAGGLAAQR